MKKSTLKQMVITTLISIVMLTNIAFASSVPATTAAPATNTAAPATNAPATNAQTPGLDLNQINNGQITNNSTNTSIINITRKILEILQLIGICLGLVMLMIIGIKFVISIGKDAPDKKEVIINYVFGAVLIFGATGILTLIQHLVINFQSSI